MFDFVERDDILAKTARNLLYQLRNTVPNVDISFSPSPMEARDILADKQEMVELQKELEKKEIDILQFFLTAIFSTELLSIFQNSTLEHGYLAFSEAYGQETLDASSFADIKKYVKAKSSLYLHIETTGFNEGFLKALAEDSTTEERVLDEITIFVDTSESLQSCGVLSLHLLNKLERVTLNFTLVDGSSILSPYLRKIISANLKVTDMTVEGLLMVVLNENCQRLSITHSKNVGINIKELTRVIILARKLNYCQEVSVDTLKTIKTDKLTRTQLKVLLYFDQEEVKGRLIRFHNVRNEFSDKELTFIERYAELRYEKRE